MSISAIFGTRISVLPNSFANKAAVAVPWGNNGGGGSGMVIECSSRPTKKATAHHRKTRPRKTQAWDIKRKPTVYAPLPPLPPEWTLLSSASAEAEVSSDAAALPSSAAEAPPITD